MKLCPVCGKSKHPGAIYCSIECQLTQIRERERLGTDHMDDMLSDTDHLEDMIEKDTQ